MTAIQLDESPEDLEQYWSDRRSAARHGYPIQQVVAAALDAAGAPLHQSFAPVQCHDISRGGISFFWPGVPSFTDIAFYLVRDSACSLLTATVRHCRQVLLDGKPVFLVGCQFTTRLPEIAVDEQLAAVRLQPAAHCDETAAQASLVAVGESPAVTTPQRMPIMLVEERRNSLQECVDCLESAFPREAAVIPFEDSTHALEYLRHHRVSILVTDLHMQHSAGKQLVLALRRHGHFAHCYLLTEVRTPELLMEALEAGVTDFMDKPLNRVEFLHTVRQAINWQRRWQETLGQGAPRAEDAATARR